MKKTSNSLTAFIGKLLLFDFFVTAAVALYFLPSSRMGSESAEVALAICKYSLFALFVSFLLSYWSDVRRGEGEAACVEGQNRNPWEH